MRRLLSGWLVVWLAPFILSSCAGTKRVTQPVTNVRTPASGVPLGDCAYIAEVQRASLKLTAAFRTVTDSNTTVPAAAIRAYTALDNTAQEVITDLSGLVLAEDLVPVNAQIVDVFMAIEQQVQAARRAASGGDLNTAAALVRTATTETGRQLSAVRQANPSVYARLDACPQP